MPTKPLSWLPRRRGLLYCSPACGANCTRAAYELARTRAQRLAKRLGPGWTDVVHENMGWHYYAAFGRRDGAHDFPVMVHEYREERPVRYAAFLAGGRYLDHGPTPTAAVKAVTQQARAHITTIHGYLDASPEPR